MHKHEIGFWLVKKFQKYMTLFKTIKNIQIIASLFFNYSTFLGGEDVGNKIILNVVIIY